MDGYDVVLKIGDEIMSLWFESLGKAIDWMNATFEAVSEYDNPERYVITIRQGGEKD